MCVLLLLLLLLLLWKCRLRIRQQLLANDIVSNYILQLHYCVAVLQPLQPQGSLSQDSVSYYSMFVSCCVLH